MIIKLYLDSRIEQRTTLTLWCSESRLAVFTARYELISHISYSNIRLQQMVYKYTERYSVLP